MDVKNSESAPPEQLPEQTWDLCAAVCTIGTEKPSELTDEALMFVLRSTPNRAQIDELFSELHRRYQARVTSWCWRMVKDRDRACDLAQEVFLRAYRYIHSFRGDSKLSTWLYSITRNYCLNAIKKAGRNPAENAEQVPLNLRGDSGAAIQNQLERDEQFLGLWRIATSALSALEARVIALHYGHGLSLSLITRQLALTNPSGAKAYIVNARRKLDIALYGRRPAVRQNKTVVVMGIAA